MANRLVFRYLAKQLKTLPGSVPSGTFFCRFLSKPRDGFCHSNGIYNIFKVASRTVPECPIWLSLRNRAQDGAQGFSFRRAIFTVSSSGSRSLAAWISRFALVGSPKSR